MKYKIYLFQDGVYSAKEAFAEGKLDGENGYVKLSPIAELPYECEAYVQLAKASNPSWVENASNYFDIETEKVKNISNSFVFFVKASERLFALTYGYGYAALDKKKIEHNFGLRVVLNEVDPAALRSVVSRNIDTSTTQTQVATSRNSEIYDFKFQLESDMLRMVSGLPLNEELGSRMAGADSLTIQSRVDFKVVGQLCTKYLESFHKDSYKKHFSFIDQRKEVKDPSLILELNKLFDIAYKNKDTTAVFFANPELRDVEDIDYYELACGKEKLRLESIDNNEVFSKIEESNLNSVLAKEIMISTYTQNDERITPKTTLYEYAIFEADYENRKYILILGSWFEIDKDFYEEVNNFVKRIEDFTDSNFLPPINEGENEKDYNERVALSNNYLVLDRKNFPVIGHEKVEVADLLTPGLEFICVKRETQSSTLSHLFKQGTVSARMHGREPKYRKFIVDQISKAGSTIGYTEDTENREIRFVYAISTSKKGLIGEVIPFFSKVNLMESVKIMRELGCQVAVAKIKKL